MQAAASSPLSILVRWASRWCDWLPRTGHASRLDDDVGLLGEARDLADLEQRLRRLEQGRVDRFGPLPRLP